MTNWKFCIRAQLPRGARLHSEENEIQLDISDQSGRFKIVGVGKRNPELRNASAIRLEGGPFDTPEKAVSAGQLGRRQLMLFSLEEGFAIDVGDLGSDHDITSISASNSKQRVHKDDLYGLYIVEVAGGEEADYGWMDTSQTVLKPIDPLERIYSDSTLGTDGLTEKQLRAYDAYASASFQQNPGAGFLLLVMAIEFLMETDRQADEVCALMDDFIEQIETELTQIDARTKQSLKSRLGLLKEDSLRQTGLALIREHLGESEFRTSIPTGEINSEEELEEMKAQIERLEAEDYFDQCYKIRSDLVHGNGVETEKIERFRPGLAKMVRSLLWTHITGRSR